MLRLEAGPQQHNGRAADLAATVTSAAMEMRRLASSAAYPPCKGMPDVLYRMRKRGADSTLLRRIRSFGLVTDFFRHSSAEEVEALVLGVATCFAAPVQDTAQGIDETDDEDYISQPAPAPAAASAAGAHDESSSETSGPGFQDEMVVKSTFLHLPHTAVDDPGAVSAPERLQSSSERLNQLDERGSRLENAGHEDGLQLWLANGPLPAAIVHEARIAEELATGQLEEPRCQALCRPAACSAPTPGDSPSSDGSRPARPCDAGLVGSFGCPAGCGSCPLDLGESNVDSSDTESCCSVVTLPAPAAEHWRAAMFAQADDLHDSVCESPALDLAPAWPWPPEATVSAHGADGPDSGASTAASMPDALVCVCAMPADGQDAALSPCSSPSSLAPTEVVEHAEAWKAQPGVRACTNALSAFIAHHSPHRQVLSPVRGSGRF